MIIKTGIDIIEVSRIEDSITKFGDSFLNRIYTRKEIEYCESKKIQKYQSYAGRFAGKEAVFKAISSFLDNKFNIEWKDIEILNDESGRPFVKFSEALQKKLHTDIRDCGVINSNLKSDCDVDALNTLTLEIDLSISHVSSVAVANAVFKMEEK